MTEDDILYQNGDYWVCAAAKSGFEVYRDGTTHSTRVAVIGYEGVRGLERAKLECDERAKSSGIVG